MGLVRGFCAHSLLYYYYTAFPNDQHVHILASQALSSVVLALYLILAKMPYCFQAMTQYHTVLALELSYHDLEEEVGKCFKVQNKHNSFS